MCIVLNETKTQKDRYTFSLSYVGVKMPIWVSDNDIWLYDSEYQKLGKGERAGTQTCWITVTKHAIR